jgi:N6-adenosine-specific RNA methylase IME4
VSDKICSRCRQTKPLDEFKSDARKPDGKASACKACVAVPRVGEMVIGQPLQVMPPVLMSDASAWALLINARWRESLEKIMESGRYLIAAKAALPHGEFGLMIETQLVFSASTAQRLMAIAADGRLSNPAHVQYLPPYWGTLYEIHKLSDDEIERGIEDGVIRPDMERREVALIGRKSDGDMYDAYPSQGSDGSGSPVEDNSRPHGESLQQGLDTSSKPGTADNGPQGEGSDAADVANPEATSDRASHVPPGPSEAISILPRDEAGKLTPEAKKALAPIIKEIRIDKIEAKKERRAEREAGWGKEVQALPDKMYGVAIEDFEWDHEAWSPHTGIDRHPSMHYETATDAHTAEEIVARCAERFKCLVDDCILFKWSTIPHLAIAIKVLELQGFDYVTHLIWHKQRPGAARGPGYWFTGEHEVILVGTRGNVVPPFPAHFRSLFSAPVGAHSEKPPNIHEIIEHHWPSVPKIEFNARRARAGWKTWGNQAQQAPANTEAAE